jgi:GNAT superfamily N-acetyltransferase
MPQINNSSGQHPKIGINGQLINRVRTSPSWSIREYRPEDVEAVRVLFAEVVHDLRPREHFIWKYNKNPAGQCISVVAEDSGKIVGQHALMPTWLRIGEEVVLGAQGFDAMTHPDYRNQGIFTALTRASEELAAKKGVKVLYGFPGKNSYHALTHRLNWELVGHIPMWIRALNSGAFKSYSIPIRQVLSVGIPLLPVGNSTAPGIEIRMQAPTLDELGSLTGSMYPENEKGICRIERTKEWIVWRFDPASQRQYLWFTAYRGGKAKACAVFATECWGDLPLIDVLGYDAQALEAVVSKATLHAKELGLPIVEAITNDGNAERALKSCGYLRRKSIPLIVKSLTTGNVDFHSSWRIASADVDTF